VIVSITAPAVVSIVAEAQAKTPAAEPPVPMSAQAPPDMSSLDGRLFNSWSVANYAYSLPDIESDFIDPVK
jgi:hypothetical protein